MSLLEEEFYVQQEPTRVPNLHTVPLLNIRVQNKYVIDKNYFVS